MEILLKGLVIGVSIAAPVGPIGLLCIRRSLAEGPRSGLVTGLGAATADALYGLVAGLGLTAVSGFLVARKGTLGIVGGLYLVYLGIRTFRSRPAAAPAELKASGLASAYFSTVLLTLTNPATILSFVAVFAGLGLGTAADYRSAGTLVLGVFAGSAAWWLALSSGVGLVRDRMKPAWLQAVNRASGVILVAFGAFALATAFG